MGIFQVLGFAAFFALVFKSTEDEEEPMASLPGYLSSPGNGAGRGLESDKAEKALESPTTG